MAVLNYLDPLTQQYVPMAGNPPLTEPTGFRNVIRNGDMQIAQRGNGPYGMGGALYGVDGWLSYTEAADALGTRDAPVPGVVGYSFKFVTGTQTGSGSSASLGQRIEDVSTLAGKIVTISFRAKALTGTPKISFLLAQKFGSGGSAQVNTPIPPVTVSTAWSSYSVTTNLPSITGKTTGSNSCLDLAFFFSAGSNITDASGIGIQNNTFFITDVQLEEGPVATPFERLPVQQQLAWCQRYFVRYGQGPQGMLLPNPGNYARIGLGNARTDKADILVNFPVVMRAGPTMNRTAGPSAYVVTDGLVTPGCTAIVAGDYAPTPTNANIFAHAAGLTAGRGIVFAVYANVEAYLDFSAEL